MIIVLLIYIFIALVQVPGMIKKKYWRELAAFSFFYIAAFILSILYVLDVKIPSPYKGIAYVIVDVLHLKY